MPLNGYTCLRTTNALIPVDIQHHLMMNIGKNERVIIADFLMPVVCKSIKSKIELYEYNNRTRFISQIKKMCSEYHKMDNENYALCERLPIAIQLFRYINTFESHPIYGLKFAEMIICKCVTILNDIDNIYREDKKIIHVNRSQLQTDQLRDFEEFTRMREKLSKEANRCLSHMIQYREHLISQS